MTSAYRASLSEDQNKAVELANRLASLDVNTLKLLNKSCDEEDEARVRMRKKVKTIARMARMFKTLRQENETVIRLKGICPGHRLAPGLLLAGKERLTSELDMFDHATDCDAINEKRPEAQ